MLHYDVEAVVTKLMLPHRYFLKAYIVLKHFTKVDGNGLADGLVDGVLNIEFLERVVTRVKHTQYTNYTIMVDLVVS